MPMTTELARTPLYDWHVAHGGRMVDFAGWSMPVQYTSIVEEHRATRSAVGVFDVSHMGRLQFFGRAAAGFLDWVLTRRTTDMKPGQVRYGLICYRNGLIVDDVLVYCLASNVDDHELTPSFQMVVNAGNVGKVVHWLDECRRPQPGHFRDIEKEVAYKVFHWWNKSSGQQHSETTELTILNCATEQAMIAVQGPKTLEVLSPFFQMHNDPSSLDLSSVRYYHCTRGMFDGMSVLVSRTGYTGEDGVEIICKSEEAREIWERILSAADEVGGMAVGLGARDSLRLEAAMPLYDHELTGANPFQAGLDFAVNLDGRDFVGRKALTRAAKDSSLPVRVGLELDGRRVPRQGCAVLQGDEPVGEVTSGTFSPTFERPIAMAYVRPSAQAVGTRLAVDIRGTPHAAVVVPLPFYKRGRQS